jgi:transposase-like protein
LAVGVELPALQGGRRLDGAAGPLALRSLPLRDVGHGRNYFSGQPSFADDLVSRYLAMSGTVEVDETYWGTEESGLIGRLTVNKAIIAVAVEEDGRKIGRVRLQTIPNLTRVALHGFIAASVEPGSTVRTDGFKSYLGLDGYVHQRHVQTELPEKNTCCLVCIASLDY